MTRLQQKVSEHSSICNINFNEQLFDFTQNFSQSKFNFLPRKMIKISARKLVKKLFHLFSQEGKFARSVNILLADFKSCRRVSTWNRFCRAPPKCSEDDKISIYDFFQYLSSPTYVCTTSTYWKTRISVNPISLSIFVLFRCAGFMKKLKQKHRGSRKYSPETIFFRNEFYFLRD